MKTTLTALTLMACTTAPALAETSFTVLGSGGGPLARADRSQPANLLVVNDRLTLVEVGDGVSIRLAAKRIRMGEIDDVVISHLHFDHVGGLLAVLGQRFQTDSFTPLNIYGPLGTAAMVDGLLDGMAPSMEAAYGLENTPVVSREQLVNVTEVAGGDSFTIGDTTVSTVTNTHYGDIAHSDLADTVGSLAFRFDTPDRSIAFTGDTGWSDEIVTLSKGADLLIAEMIDLPSVMANIRRIAPAEAVPGIEKHLSEHHISPAQVAELAKAAGVKTVVASHLVAGAQITPAETEAWAAEIAKGFDGEVKIAQDLTDY